MTSDLPDLHSLRLLVEVESQGSLGRAARSQQISQPAASKRIAQLERELGMPLLDRAPTGSRLTAQGHVVADWARRILEAVDGMLAAAAALRSAGGPGLQVAASMTIAEHLIPRWLSQIRSAHPALHIGLEVANSEQVQVLVLLERADIGFVEGPAIDSRLRSYPIATDRLAVVVPPGHPWAGRTKALCRHELVSSPLVVREPGSGTRLTLDQILGHDRAEPLLELGSNEAVKGAVLAGVGPAVISVLAVESELASRRLIELSVAGMCLTRSLAAVWPRGSGLSEPGRWLLETAATAAASPVVPGPACR